jgi:chromosome segregation ATPase
MAEKNKIPKEIDDKIQSLAGEIYVQIEEKVTNFVLGQQQNNDLTDEKIAQLPQYQTLVETLSLEKNKYSSLENTLADTIKEYQEKSQSLEATIKEQQQLITNNSAFNAVKQTDTETVLQDKLAENATLLEKVKFLETTNEQHKEQVSQTESLVKEQNAQLETLRHSETNLQKNTQAKAATLDIQNQQISELQNQLNISLAELAHIKAEQTQHTSTSKLALTEYQQREQSFKQQVEQATTDQKQSQALIESLHLKITDLEKNNQSLQKNNAEQTAHIQSQEKSIAANKQQFDEQVVQHSLAQTEKDKITVDKNAQIDELQMTNEKVSGQLATTTSSLKETQDKQRDQEKTFIVLKTEHLELQQSNAQLQQTIEEQQQKFEEEKTANIHQQQQAKEKLAEIAQRLASSEEKQSKNAHTLIQLQQSYDNLATSFEQAKQEVDHYQIITENLTNDLEQATKNIEQNQQRHSAQIEKRDKQEVEYNKARDTIKYLRDENTELTQKLDQQVSELETKLTEYRLRFEYAQKELAKK